MTSSNQLLNLSRVARCRKAKSQGRSTMNMQISARPSWKIITRFQISSEWRIYIEPKLTRCNNMQNQSDWLRRRGTRQRLSGLSEIRNERSNCKKWTKKNFKDYTLLSERS